MTRVLIVDDNEENIYYLTALLRAHGCEVDSARHGAEALVKARCLPPTLVISDLLMPVMDGYTLLRHWKADPQLKHTPFVVYTATYTAPEDEMLALSLGADAFILKPSEPEDFLARLREVQAREVADVPAQVQEPAADETEQLRGYSEALIRKLEQKTLQLEESNRLLQKDIAARALAEVALRESEERFRQLAETIDDVFWLSDCEPREIYYVSPAFETMWMRSRQSLYDNPGSWYDVIHPEDRERLNHSLVRYATGTWDETYRILRGDDSIRWVRSRAYPVLDADGQPYRVVGVSRDITEVRQLEDQFRQAQKMEAIGRLAGGVAHDFNNLLSVILSYASMTLEQLEPGDRSRGNLQEILRAGERATDLTRQLLAFSRQQVLEPHVLDLSEVVFDAEKMLQRLLGEDIELTLHHSTPSGRVHADRSQLEQIVVNLAVNARDAMPRGGQLRIEMANVDVAPSSADTRRGVAPGRYVMLAVSDTGEGIDAATRERIFEPFFTTKANGKGTGLGLSTVFGIVQQSQGHIEVESGPPRGTTFRVYLPRTDLVPEAAGPTPPRLATLRGSETILLVEDDAQVREMARVILAASGYRVLDAANGEEALRLAEVLDGPLHLLLTDVLMPRMGGRELAELVVARRPDTKVLYVSGYTQSSVAALLDAGAAFLQKPITPEALLRRVRELLGTSHEAADPNRDPRKT